MTNAIDQALSVDTHRTQGRFEFTVRPGTMSWTEIASAILRGAHLAALASLFATLLFVRTLPRLSRAHPLQARLDRLALGSLLAGLTPGVIWFLLLAASLAGAEVPAARNHCPTSRRAAHAVRPPLSCAPGHTGRLVAADRPGRCRGNGPRGVGPRATDTRWPRRRPLMVSPVTA